MRLAREHLEMQVGIQRGQQFAQRGFVLQQFDNANEIGVVHVVANPRQRVLGRRVDALAGRKATRALLSADQVQGMRGLKRSREIVIENGMLRGSEPFDQQRRGIGLFKYDHELPFAHLSAGVLRRQPGKAVLPYATVANTLRFCHQLAKYIR